MAGLQQKDPRQGGRRPWHCVFLREGWKKTLCYFSQVVLICCWIHRSEICSYKESSMSAVSERKLTNVPATMRCSEMRTTDISTVQYEMKV